MAKRDKKPKIMPTIKEWQSRPHLLEIFIAEGK